MAGQRMQNPDKKPFQLDRCHALSSDAPATAKFYPQWYRGDKPDANAAAEPDEH
jgi:hypothetical protein